MKRNSKKSALLTTALAVIMAGAMLLGGTIAWFTDSVESKENIIKSGTLDVEMTWSDEFGGTYKDASEGAIFNYTLWEPGYTDVKYVKIANVGSLAFKFQLNLIATESGKVIDGKEYKLSDVIDVYIGEGQVSSRSDLVNMKYAGTLGELMADADGAAYGKMLAGEAQTVTIALKMQESAGNEYQGLSIGEGISVQLMAEQLPHEEDNFGPDYDENAGMPVAALRRNFANENTPIEWDGYGIWQPDAGYETYPLEAAYVFSATEKDVSQNPYKDWFCDFYVALDRDLTANQIFLGGSYADFCVGFNVDDEILEFGDFDGDGTGVPTLPANTFIPLLGAATGGMSNWTYEGIVEGVQQFGCGVSDIDDALTGAVFTVELRLINPENPEDMKVVSKVDYTFVNNVADAATLREYLAAGNDVELVSDIVLNDQPVSIPAGKSVTLDLNGHTLSGISTSSSSSNLIKVENGAELTITGGKVSFGATTPDTNWGGEGQPAFPGYANNTISNVGTLIIDGATIENVTAPGGASYAIDNYQGSTLIINDGVINGHGKCAIRVFANAGTEAEACNLTVNGGSITGKRGIWIQLPGSDAGRAPYVNLTVNGGTITGTNADDCAIYSYSYGNSFANVKVNLNGGTFNGDVAFGGGYKGDQETVSVTGGTFNGELGRYIENDGWVAIAKP